jgi:hypothetical protein
MPVIVAPAPDPVGMALSLFFQHGSAAPAVAAARRDRARRDALAEVADFWAAVAAAMERDDARETMVAGWRRLLRRELCGRQRRAVRTRNA